MTISQLRSRILFNSDGTGGGAGSGSGGGQQNNNSGGGDGDGDGDDPVKKAVEAATSGLKKNRDEILAEKRALQEQLDKAKNDRKFYEELGGEDGVKKLLDFKKKLEKDESTKLLAEGKHDEWFDKRTAALRGEYEQKLTKQAELLTEREQQLAATNDRLARVMIQNDVQNAARTAGVVPSAVADIELVAMNTFEFDPEHDRHVIKDKDGVVLLGKDGQNPKSLGEWLDEQKESRRHWWPQSQGAGAAGGAGGRAGAPDMKAIGQMSMSEYNEYRKKQGMGSGYGGRVRSK